MRKPMTDEQKARKKEKDREYCEKIKADPELAARRLAMSQASKAKRMADPDYAAREREKSRARTKRNRERDPEKTREAVYKHRRKNREKVLAKQREYQRNKRADPVFREEKRKRDREYNARPEAKARRRVTERAAQKKRLQNPEYRILQAVKKRTRGIRRLFQLGRIPRVERTRFLDYFGAEPSIVLAHIEAQFVDGMTWENCGKAWHLDHIVPICCGAGNIDLLTKLNHYKNLRPLSPSENHRKRDKMPDFFPEGVPFTPEECGWSPPPLKERGPTEVRVQDAGDSAVGVATGA